MQDHLAALTGELQLPRILHPVHREGVRDELVELRAARTDHLHHLGRVAQIPVPHPLQRQAAGHHVVHLDVAAPADECDVPATARGLDGELLRGGHGGAVHRLVRAAAAGQRLDLLHGVGIFGIDHRRGAQLQREARPVRVRIHADDPRAAIDAVDHAAQPHRPQPDDQHRIEAAHLHVLHRAEGWSQTAAGHRGMVIRDAVRDRQEQPILLDAVLRIGCGAGLAAAERQRVDAVLAMDVVAGVAQVALAAGILRHHDHPVADLDAARLRDRHHLAGGLVADAVGRLASPCTLCTRCTWAPSES